MSELPEGFIPHDGGPCPVPLDSYPRVMLRGGELDRGVVTASFWTGETDDWWQWMGDAETNIIAYKPEDQTNAD